MIIVFGEGRGFRVAWLLEEMRLAYRQRSVGVLAGVENDATWLRGGDWRQHRADAAGFAVHTPCAIPVIERCAVRTPSC